jgi:hypothetical protein
LLLLVAAVVLLVLLLAATAGHAELSHIFQFLLTLLIEQHKQLCHIPPQSTTSCTVCSIPTIN